MAALCWFLEGIVSLVNWIVFPSRLGFELIVCATMPFDFNILCNLQENH